MATIGVEQHTFRTTVMGCVGECDPIGNFQNHHWGHPLATKASGKNVIGGWVGDDWG